MHAYHAHHLKSVAAQNFELATYSPHAIYPWARFSLLENHADWRIRLWRTIPVRSASSTVFLAFLASLACFVQYSLTWIFPMGFLWFFMRRVVLFYFGPFLLYSEIVVVAVRSWLRVHGRGWAHGDMQLDIDMQVNVYMHGIKQVRIMQEVRSSIRRYAERRSVLKWITVRCSMHLAASMTR